MVAERFFGGGTDRWFVAEDHLFYSVIQKKYSNAKIAISQKCVNVFAPNVSHLFKTKLHLSESFRAIFTPLTSK